MKKREDYQIKKKNIELLKLYIEKKKKPDEKSNTKSLE